LLDAFNLEGRRAVVTGGGGGLGGAMAEALYQAGADVAIIGHSDTIVETAARIGSSSRPVHTVRCDLTDRQALVERFEEAVAKLEGIDILVTSHGIVLASDSADASMEEWDKSLEINLNSVFALCQLSGKRMIAQGRGKIINIASMLSFSGGFRVAAYAASKGGVSQLTKALANEWSSKGVNVNAIAPGYVRTRLNRHVWTDPVRSEQILVRIPAGRWGEPDDMKGAVVFLASSASDYIHGAVLPVDGGFLAR
jgi:2-dehydro-3-deoxy-D-gluconate 5-dehydrogenase